MKRRLLVLLLALVAAFAGPGVAHAGDNAAVAINTKDGSSLFKLAFAIRHVMSDVVDQANGAVAYAQCESCQTTAIAIEIVLVEGSPTTVAPTNVSIAVNQSCTLCDTFASAYQFVLFTGGPVHITADGLKALHDIRAQIRSWGKEGLSNDEIRARLPALIDGIKQVLATQLVPAGKSDNGGQPDEGDTTTDEGGPPAETNSTPTATTEGGSVTTTTPTTTETTTQPTTTTPGTTTEPTTTTTP